MRSSGGVVESIRADKPLCSLGARALAQDQVSSRSLVPVYGFNKVVESLAKDPSPLTVTGEQER